MTTTYNSNLVAKKARNRGLYAGQPNPNNGRIFLPAGTVLAIGDILLGVPIGENMIVTDVNAVVLGNSGTLAGSFGYFQILDKAGNPVVVKRNGPFSATADIYTSPASSGAAYKAAGAITGYVNGVVAAPAKAAGPVNVGIIVTTAGTMAVDTELFIGAVIRGENSTKLTVGGGNTPNTYLLS